MVLFPALVMLLTAASGGSGPVNMEEIQENLRQTVTYLSENIGQRSYLDTARLTETADYIERTLKSFGCLVQRQPFTYRGKEYFNVIGEIKGALPPEEGIIVIGAHYDTVSGTPGADDNASGIAALLELARLAAKKPPVRTIRFAAFSLEEPPVFRTKHMGSYIYAQSLRRQNAKVSGMISLEMLGCYSDEAGSQWYPLPFFRFFYPDRGNFIAFVGNIRSRSFTVMVKRGFKKASSLPVESLNTLFLIPGVDFSDHRNFWKFGYPAFMVTDTAFYRNENYHSPGDLAGTLDYAKMAEVVKGIHESISSFR